MIDRINYNPFTDYSKQSYEHQDHENYDENSNKALQNLYKNMPYYDEEETKLDKMAEYISQAKQEQAPATNKTPEKKSDAAKYKDKDAFSIAAGQAANHWISTTMNRSFISKLTKLTPTSVGMAVFGVDFEEDGNALKKGAIDGKGGDFKQAFTGLIKNYDKAIEEAMKKGTWATVKESFKQTLGFIPTTGAAIVTNALKYAGKGLSKVLGKDVVAALGSGVAVVGKLLNSIGESVTNVLSGTFNGIKALLSGDTKKAAESFKNIGRKFKEMGIAIKNKVVEFFKDTKNFIVNTAKAVETIVTKAVPKAAEAVKTVVTKVIPNAAKTVWNEVKNSKYAPWNWFRRR